MRVIAIQEEFFGLAKLTRIIKKMCPSGTEVKGFKESSDALQYAQEHPVDVAFLDMEITQLYGQIDGQIMAKKLKEINPKTNLIFMSVSRDYYREAWTVYASDYLLKPFDSQRVGQAMMNLRYAVAE